jgi:hypothetical protein
MASLLQPDQPLYLPQGSVRAILALGVAAAYVGGLIDNLEIVTLVFGFYFGQKVSE